jgi:hypothetical protein
MDRLRDFSCPLLSVRTDVTLFKLSIDDHFHFLDSRIWYSSRNPGCGIRPNGKEREWQEPSLYRDKEAVIAFVKLRLALCRQRLRIKCLQSVVSGLTPRSFDRPLFSGEFPSKSSAGSKHASELIVLVQQAA